MELRPKPGRSNSKSKTFLMRVGVVERLRLTIKPLGNRAEKPSDTLRRLKAAISTKNSKEGSLRGSYEFPLFQQRQNAPIYQI